MPRLEKTILINSPVEKVYEVLVDLMTLPRWNIVVTSISEVETDKYLLNTTVGEMTNTVIEKVPNEKISSTQENSPMQSIGYIFNPKGDDVDVTLWCEFELADQESVLDVAADLFLKSLKAYMIYLAEGGDPEKYKKRIGKINKIEY